MRYSPVPLLCPSSYHVNSSSNEVNQRLLVEASSVEEITQGTGPFRFPHLSGRRNATDLRETKPATLSKEERSCSRSWLSSQPPCVLPGLPQCSVHPNTFLIKPFLERVNLYQFLCLQLITLASQFILMF